MVCNEEEIHHFSLNECEKCLVNNYKFEVQYNIEKFKRIFSTPTKYQLNNFNKCNVLSNLFGRSPPTYSV